jgi:glycerol-3-phosphate dehydrogenase (NAD(P)+)
VARAVRKKAEKGELDLKNFPLLLHVDDLLAGKTDAQLPWESFTFRQFR